MLYTVDDTQLVMIDHQGLLLARVFHRKNFLLTENAQKNLKTLEDQLEKMWGNKS